MFPQEPDAETQGPDQETAAMNVDQQTATTNAGQPAFVSSTDQLPADPDPPMVVEVSESDQSVVEAAPSKRKAKRSKHKRKKQKKIKARLMKKVYVMARKWVRKNKIDVDESESSSSGVSDGPSDLESEEDAPTTGLSRDKSSSAGAGTSGFSVSCCRKLISGCRKARRKSFIRPTSLCISSRVTESPRIGPLMASSIRSHFS